MIPVPPAIMPKCLAVRCCVGSRLRMGCTVKWPFLWYVMCPTIFSVIVDVVVGGSVKRGGSVE